MIKLSLEEEEFGYGKSFDKCSMKLAELKTMLEKDFGLDEKTVTNSQFHTKFNKKIFGDDYTVSLQIYIRIDDINKLFYILEAIKYLDDDMILRDLIFSPDNSDELENQLTSLCNQKAKDKISIFEKDFNVNFKLQSVGESQAFLSNDVLIECSPLDQSGHKFMNYTVSDPNLKMTKSLTHKYIIVGE